MVLLAPPSAAPNPYPAAADLIRRLPNLAQAARDARGLTVKQAAAQAGVGADTLASFEAGSNCTKSTLLAVIGWLGGLS